MKLTKILTLFLLLGSLLSFGQEPKRSEGAEAIVNAINKNTKGISFIISDTGINSELNEIGTTFFKNKYIILSNKKRRHADVTVNPITNTPNNNLYCVDVKEDGNLSFPLLFSQALDSENEEGSIGFSSDQRTIFFTQENPTNKQLFTLHKATLNEKDAKKWTDITNLKIVPEQYSAETPSVSPDGKKIYIATNIPGGFGGFDIYEATIAEDGTIGNLVNLGPNVNTADDEKYPYMSSDNKYLYFSSKGHLNLGGYDVFRSAYVDNSFLTAMNLGTDLNSRRDDVAFVMTSPSKGYISTDKHQSGNFDILKFDIKKQDNLFFNYTIVEEVTKTALPNATVVVTDEFGTKLAETQSDNNGKIKLALEPLTTYNVVVNKDGYETKKLNIATGDTDKNIALTQKKAVVTDDAIVIENIYFDFNKSSIKKESELSLNKIVEVLKNNTNMSITINAHTDSKGTDTYNQTLSESRAKSAYQYLLKKGIPATQLTYKGFGESELLEKCEKCTAKQDQTNRRVEFKIVK
ncbi:OmpA family protein [Flavobacterium lacisediminis]|uniref:OmpA family protein n=1 Tax=Flavobacterium lacisediminis TaxID=2989705 RepID=A0ABT3EF32_9FLAO|nr:OmpA family protein [Flavobacterium lacisediminis]MCW1147193.1 OmpA family protein [Flavobacterium lacisediminis]